MSNIQEIQDKARFLKVELAALLVHNKHCNNVGKIKNERISVRAKEVEELLEAIYKKDTTVDGTMVRKVKSPELIWCIDKNPLNRKAVEPFPAHNRLDGRVIHPITKVSRNAEEFLIVYSKDEADTYYNKFIKFLDEGGTNIEYFFAQCELDISVAMTKPAYAM